MTIGLKYRVPFRNLACFILYKALVHQEDPYQGFLVKDSRLHFLQRSQTDFAAQSCEFFWLLRSLLAAKISSTCFYLWPLIRHLGVAFQHQPLTSLCCSQRLAHVGCGSPRQRLCHIAWSLCGELDLCTRMGSCCRKSLVACIGQGLLGPYPARTWKVCRRFYWSFLQARGSARC